jgi:predicted nucleotidyltransferase component of viral defense system
LDLTGYQKDTIEKVNRLSDILLSIGNSELLRHRLSFYGGTALNLLHLKSVTRLSEDIDFNFREAKKGEWGEVRSEIDIELKDILHFLGYSDKNIFIQARYNQSRFMIEYEKAAGGKDLLKIETGYMRRMPILARDAFYLFEHPTTGERVRIKSPIHEELYANKFCTMYSRAGKRSSGRDIFDVCTISEQSMENGLFTDLAMLEALLCDVSLEDYSKIEKIKIDRLEKLVRSGLKTEIIRKKAMDFAHRITQQCMDKGWMEFKETFWSEGKIRTALLENRDKINPRIENHPQLLWLRKKKKLV